MEGREYAGWTNYETLLVAQWIDRDALSRQHWREAVAEAKREAATCAKSTENTAEASEASRLLLADWLQQELRDRFPLTEPDIYADLLNASLTRVSWPAIAATLLSRFDQDRPNGGDADDRPVGSTQAIDKASLIDVTEIAQAVGIKFSVAVTPEVWRQCVAVPEDIQGEDERSRLRGILQTLRRGLAKDRCKSLDPLDFAANTGSDRTPPVTLCALWTSSDEAEPVVIIVLREG